MRVLLTGGFGYVGAAAGLALATAGARVYALCRDASEARQAHGRGWEPVEGALEDLAALGAAAGAVDAVMHCAARDTPAFLQVQRAALAALIGGLPRGGVLAMQAGTLGFGAAPEPLDGAGPLSPPPFLASRVAMEEEAGRHAARRGVRFAVIHAALAWGGAGGAIPTAMAMVARALGYVPLPPPGLQRWATVHVQDWGALLARAAFAAPPGMSRFVAAAGEVSMAEFSDRLGAAMALPVRLAGAEALTRLGPLGPALALPQRFDATRAEAALGWTPRETDLDGALRVLATRLERESN
jgi:nucleoside-diphosphate-sugar epimerase